MLICFIILKSINWYSFSFLFSTSISNHPIGLANSPFNFNPQISRSPNFPQTILSGSFPYLRTKSFITTSTDKGYKVIFVEIVAVLK